MASSRSFQQSYDIEFHQTILPDLLHGLVEININDRVYIVPVHISGISYYCKVGLTPSRLYLATQKLHNKLN